MDTFEEKWYWCAVQDAGEEPDWALIPEERRELVRSQWKMSQRKLKSKRWKLWGPQITMYSQTPGMNVVVLGEV